MTTATDVASSLAPPTAAAVATTVIATAFSTWGSWALVLIALGVMLWHSRSEKNALKAENAKLREQLDEIQAKRIEDAQKLIRVTETSTATTAARTEGDQRFHDLVNRLTDKVEDLDRTVGDLTRPRQTRRPSR